MELTSGARIGPYEIISPVGAGGMGAVYKARDTRLDRLVAIKVSDARFSDRFGHEARAVAALNHPNICQLYDVGPDYLVMEFVEGKPLARPGSVRQFFDLAVQMAEGLAAAHAAGLVHRDLKPDNILVTPAGRVKILDFGLAKPVTTPADHEAPTQEMADARPLTTPGTAVGTVGYMSPEQARGATQLTAQSDQFSFGIILYELATGVRPFRESSAAETLAAIMRDEPAPLPPSAPGRWIIERLLAKDPQDRYDSTRDLSREIQQLRARLSEPAGQAASAQERQARPSGVSRAGLASAIGLTALIAVGATWFIVSRSPTTGPVISPKRFVIDVPAPRLQTKRGLALSPDGSTLVYQAGSYESSQVYVRRFNQEKDSHLLAGTVGSQWSSVSPDGKWIAFATGRTLNKIPVGGGPIQPLCSCRADGLAWLSPEQVVFADHQTGGLSRVAADGGAPEPITVLDAQRGELRHTRPSVLPDRSGVLFSIVAAGGATRVAIKRFGSDRPSTLIEGAAAAVALPDDRILFTQSGALFAAELRKDAVGPPTKLVDGVVDEFAASMDGTVAFFETSDQNRRSLVWVDRRGREEPIGNRRGAFNHVSLSPDGSRLAVDVESAEGVLRRTIWMYDLKTGAFNRMTFGDPAEFPVWSPDGSRLTFSQSGENRGIYWQMADASQPAERLFATGNALWPGSWTRNGQRLAYMEGNLGTGGDIGVFDIGGQPRLLIHGPATEWGAKLSPDDRCLAYVSQETGDWEVSVRRFPEPDTRVQVSSGGGTEVVWARDGRELFYRGARGLIAVPMTTTTACTPGAPDVLFPDLDYLVGSPGAHAYDVSRDGRSFVMVKAGEDELRASRSIHVLVNWPAALGSRR